MGKAGLKRTGQDEAPCTSRPHNAHYSSAATSGQGFPVFHSAGYHWRPIGRALTWIFADTPDSTHANLTSSSRGAETVQCQVDVTQWLVTEELGSTTPVLVASAADWQPTHDLYSHNPPPASVGNANRVHMNIRLPLPPSRWHGIYCWDNYMTLFTLLPSMDDYLGHFPFLSTNVSSR